MHPKLQVSKLGHRLAQTKDQSARRQRAIDAGCDCANCPFAVEGKPHLPVYGAGPSKPKGLLVAESPGYEESQEGEPLVGPTGRQLDEELTEIGLPRDLLFKVNVVACRPPEGKTEEQMRTAMRCCRPLFEQQIAGKFKVVPTLAMGKWAAEGLTGKQKGVMKERGFVKHDIKTIVTWHPTYAFFHNPYEWGAFSIDLDRFHRYIRGKLRPGPEALITAPTVRDVQRLVRENDYVSLDIETKPSHPEQPWTGKDPTRAVIKTIGLGCSTWGLSQWWVGPGTKVHKEIKRVIEDENILKITQNGWWFDIPILERHGIRPR